jgi:hypothetical protein
MTDTSLLKELLNSNIDFVDNIGDIVVNFYSTNKNLIVSSIYTNWIDNTITHIKKNKKYTKLANIKDDYYEGNINDGKFKNMEAVLFKMKVREGCIGSIIKKYIIMIIDNPEYNDDNMINRYFLIIYIIDKIGILGRKLRVLEILKSNTVECQS